VGCHKIKIPTKIHVQTTKGILRFQIQIDTKLKLK